MRCNTLMSGCKARTGRQSFDLILIDRTSGVVSTIVTETGTYVQLLHHHTVSLSRVEAVLLRLMTSPRIASTVPTALRA